MTEPTNQSDMKENLETIREWSDENLTAAREKASGKAIQDWTEREFAVLWEDSWRKRKEIQSKLEALLGKDEFVSEDWMSFIAETAADIYHVEKSNQFFIYRIRRVLCFIIERQNHINRNISSMPPPLPPAPPDPRFPQPIESPRLRRIEDLLESILRSM